MKNKKSNPNPIRSKWDMPHSSKKDYNRREEKEYIIEVLNDIIEDLEENNLTSSIENKRN
jgi:hypothetical protein